MPPEDNKSILDGFNQLGNKNETVEILKELFDENKIEMITDLSADEIKLITRIKVISQIMDFDIWDEALKDFMRLKLSNKRKSRKEIIEAIKQDNDRKPSFFDKMMGK